MQVNGIRNNAIDGNFRSDFIYSIINFSNFVLLNIINSSLKIRQA